MFITNLDFLNTPAQLYFFEKKTNKTLLGGILFIIYFLLMITIVTFYVINYYLNDKYEVRHSRYKYYNNQSDFYNQEKDEYNYFNFSFDFFRVTQSFGVKILDDNFFLMNSDFERMERNEFNISKLEDAFFFIVYACMGNCTLDEDDLAYYLEINYNGYKMDHQNAKTPLDTHDPNNIFSKSIYFSYDTISLYSINVEVIKYKEEKSILSLFGNWMDTKKEFGCIDIESIDKREAKEIANIDIGDPGSKFIYKLLAVIGFNNDSHEIDEYIRIKRSILDVLASIGSLFSTFLTFFSFLFRFYSEKNNNYTVIKKLLSNPKIYPNSKINISKAKTIKFENISRKNKSYLNLDKKSIDTSKSVPFKSENDNIINKKIVKNNENQKKQNEEKENIIYLHKISFIDFLLDNFKFKNNKKKKNHIIINTCDKIISTYISIETILYNQVIFENLLKDYQWNNPALKKISYNFLFRKLKSLT